MEIRKGDKNGDKEGRHKREIRKGDKEAR